MTPKNRAAGLIRITTSKHKKITLKKNAKTGFSSSREYGQRPVYYMASIADKKNANSSEVYDLTGHWIYLLKLAT